MNLVRIAASAVSVRLRDSRSIRSRQECGRKIEQTGGWRSSCVDARERLTRQCDSPGACPRISAGRVAIVIPPSAARGLALIAVRQ